MTDRIIQVYTKDGYTSVLNKIADDKGAIACWYNKTSDDRIHFHLLIEAYKTQPIIDAIQGSFENETDYHLIILPVEAYLPIPKAQEDDDSVKKEAREQAKASIVREEMENDMQKYAALDRNYILLVILSTVVASIGMLENNVAVLVGAMVIAPFLSPNLALTFASAMGNTLLAWNSARTLLVGSAIALLCGIVAGQFWPMEAIPNELEMRSQVDYSSIVLALAAGSAAVLSLTKGLSSVLVGVMVAAALLPPLAASGVFLGHGLYDKAFSAIILLSVNIVCINLSGLGIFIMRGIGPRTWYDKRKAKKSIYIYAAAWSAALLALISVIAVLG